MGKSVALMGKSHQPHELYPTPFRIPKALPTVRASARIDIIGHYLGFQHKWAMFQRKIFVFQREFSILSAFSIEDFKKSRHLYCNSQLRSLQSPALQTLTYHRRCSLIFH